MQERGDTMSLCKAIESGKEHRKPYMGSKSIDPSCRNHGGCPYCEGNRLYKHRVREEKADWQIKENGTYGL